MEKTKVYYLLGALRDANLDIRKGKNYEIKFGQKDERWLEHISALIFDLFDKQYKVHNHMLRITDKKIVIKIKELSEMISPQKHWNTPSLIETENPEDLIHYIKGFWDAEGGLPKKPQEAKQKYLSFDQKNKNALSFVRENLIKLGFTPTNLTYTHEVWQFRLTRKQDIINYVQKIGSFHPEKHGRMINLIENFSP